MKSKILILALSLTLISCISEYNPSLPEKETDLLVVEGDIIGNSLCIFHLGKNVSLGSNVSEEDYTAEGTITLIDSNGNESQPAQRIAKGEYQLQIGELDANTQYGLKSIHDGNTYQSELSYPLYTPPIDSISFSQPEPYGLVEFAVSTHDSSSEIGYYRWQYEEDWEQTATYRTSIDFDTETGNYYDTGTIKFFCWHKTRNNPQTVVSTSKLIENRIVDQPIISLEPGFRFRMLYCITVIQQAISRQGFEYYESKKSANDDMGGLFSPQPSMVDGNISCISDPERKVIGYIEVSRSRESKRLFIPIGLISSSSVTECESKTMGEVMNILTEENITLSKFYKMNYRPVGDMFALELVEWATARCVDCTMNGGTKDRPDWWPDNGHY